MPRSENYGALANLDTDAAIAEIAAGTLSRQIAERHGVSTVALRKRLVSHPDYAQAVRDQAQSLVEQATELAMSCTEDEVSIARVRVDAAHKWAQARDPHNWGPKQEITLISVDLTAALEDARQRAKANEISSDALAGSCVRVQDSDATP